MPETLSAELVVDAHDELAEGPLWDDRDGVWWWTDIPGMRLHRYSPTTGQDEIVEVDRHVGAIVPRRSGGLMLAVRGGFAPYDAGQSGPLKVLVPVEEDRPTIRMNDGKCDAAGRFYASTMTFDGDEPVGVLWRLDPDLSLHRLVDGLLIGNGLAWTPAGTTMYFIDSMTSRIDAFTVDVHTGDLSDRRPVVQIPAEAGLPDGMCIDDEGALWVALFDGGAVRRYSPDGELLAVVELPAGKVTCPSFGGPDGDELFISTAWAGLDETSRSAQPHAGGIFRVRPGVTGPTGFAFAG